MTTATQLNLISLLGDMRYFQENLIIIDDRNSNQISFKYNQAQEILHGTLTNRDIVVKAGQLGITSFFLARFFRDTLMIPGITSVVVAHEEYLTQRLLQRTQVWYDRIPAIIETDQGPVRRQRMSHKGANEKLFPDINSVFYIGTARAFVFGRGDPIHRFLGSEVAFWPDVDRILVPTMQRVPLSGEMVLESTPNGAGDNTFYQLVQEAIEGTGIWKLHSLVWWLEPEYQIAKGSEYALLPDRGDLEITEEELNLIGAAGWTNDVEIEARLRWRRRKISEIRNKFWAEFFEDISSCFLASSESYYDPAELERLRQECRPFLYMWHHAKIWRKPDDDEFVEFPNFIISVDPGQGKVTKSAATAWYVTREGKPIHCATLAGLYDPITFAPMVQELGRYYKTAKIVSERNGHGMAFCSEIKNYPNLYRQTDVQSGISSKVIGWATTGAARIDGGGTKPFMLDQLNFILDQLECRDIDIINELGYVRIGAQNRIEFSGPDDLHDTVAIMAATRPTAMGHSNSGFIGAKGWNTR